MQKCSVFFFIKREGKNPKQHDKDGPLGNTDYWGYFRVSEGKKMEVRELGQLSP